MGYQVILINIAEFVVALQTADAEVAQRIRAMYADFLVSAESPRLTLDLRIVPPVLNIQPRRGELWVINTHFNQQRLTYESYLEQGEIDFAAGHGWLNMAPKVSVENFLRVAYAWLCVQNEALLLHAAGLIRDGQGYIFFGPSGAGKTTTTQLARDSAAILSDDLIIVRFHEGQPVLHGVPFKGALADVLRANQSAPLRAIYRLQQSRAHRLEPLPHALAVAELSASAPFVVRETGLSERLIAVCDRLARSVPVQRLHFARDDRFWEVIDGYFETVP